MDGNDIAKGKDIMSYNFNNLMLFLNWEIPNENSIPLLMVL